MSIALSDLVTRLTADVPAQDSVPSATQYQNAIKTAVTAFNLKLGRKKLHSFTTIAGTADYTLPDDFFKLIKLEDQFATGIQFDDVVINASGIIPLNEGIRLNDEYTIAGRTLTLIPTPVGAITRYVWYKAGHVLDGGNYPDMLDYEADIIMLKATANAWRVVTSKVQRSSGWRYKQGDVEIDKSKVGAALTGWIKSLDDEFDDLMEELIGTVGMMG